MKEDDGKEDDGKEDDGKEDDGDNGDEDGNGPPQGDKGDNRKQDQGNIDEGDEKLSHRASTLLRPPVARLSGSPVRPRGAGALPGRRHPGGPCTLGAR